LTLFSFGLLLLFELIVDPVENACLHLQGLGAEQNLGIRGQSNAF